jgi:hypothetical protein
MRGKAPGPPQCEHCKGRATPQRVDQSHRHPQFIPGGYLKQKSRATIKWGGSPGTEMGIANYLILVSLYMTCLRALGSNFMISIFAGIVRLFLSVV